jgi:hypothetical protein
VISVREAFGMRTEEAAATLMNIEPRDLISMLMEAERIVKGRADANPEHRAKLETVAHCINGLAQAICQLRVAN